MGHSIINTMDHLFIRGVQHQAGIVVIHHTTTRVLLIQQYKMALEQYMVNGYNFKALFRLS